MPRTTGHVGVSRPAVTQQLGLGECIERGDHRQIERAIDRPTLQAPEGIVDRARICFAADLALEQRNVEAFEPADPGLASEQAFEDDGLVSADGTLNAEAGDDDTPVALVTPGHPAQPPSQSPPSM